MAKRKMTVTETKEPLPEHYTSEFSVPGYEFRWVNAESRSRRNNWRHWRAVERDSEIGEQVSKQMLTEHDKFSGMNMDTNYFYRGSNMVLAYAKTEDARKYKKLLQDKAKGQVEKVLGDKDISMQQVIVPSRAVEKEKEK